MKQTVLVTGISGYIAEHAALAALRAGYAVRGTVRAQSKAEGVRQNLAAAGADISRLSFAVADLEHDAGWQAAVKDCAYILHIASPFPSEQPDGREALVPAARAGAQRVLSAGFAAGVKRIVMTSSLAAMIGQPGKGASLLVGEDDWTDPDWRALSPYTVSKTRAELSAWEYAKVQGFENRLTVINPGFVLGPAIGRDYGTSVGLINSMLAGEFSRLPKLAFPIVDVRDLAELHLAAMCAEAAAGRRLIAAGEALWMREIADIIRAAYPDKAAALPKREAANFMIRFAALLDARYKTVLSDLGTFHMADSAYVSEMTGVNFRPAKDSIEDTARYLLDANAF